MSLLCVLFFRNPKRTTPITDYLVVSPVDGRILSTDVLPVPEDLDLPFGEWRRISIFMNVFDVHVNRSPVAGKVVATAYHKGAFLNASLDKASEQNERQNMVVEMASGQKIGVVQIAGLIARRILLEAAVGDHLNVGQQYGIIRFGSRVDVWFLQRRPLMFWLVKLPAGGILLIYLANGRNYRWGLPLMNETPPVKTQLSVGIHILVVAECPYHFGVGFWCNSIAFCHGWAMGRSNCAYQCCRGI